MIQQLDVSILLWIQENLRFEVLTPVMRAVTSLGDNGWFWIALGIALLCFRRTRPVGFTVLIALAIGALITNVGLKNLVGRMRPYDYTEAIHRLLPVQTDYSFPSGHTCASFAAAIVCFRMLPRKYGIAALILAGLIAFSRMYLGVHFPTDILGGLVAAVVSAWLANRLYPWIVQKLRKRLR
ncbi:MAG: phosphatase PAP2 family protein [Lachnospiraceae bacterium]|nr:phosphatase PAP2 family protein [Lachnospiraceae bacterium]